MRGALPNVLVTRGKEQPPVDGDQVVLGELLNRGLRHGGRVVEPGEDWQRCAHDVQPGNQDCEDGRATKQCDSAHIEEDEEILPGEHESCPCETKKYKALRGDL